MSKIFVSYRRQDAKAIATLIFRPLAHSFGADQVFMDVHGIPKGVDFHDYLTEQVAKAEVLLAIIGDRWLTAVDSRRRRRIDDPDDFVRIEIEAGLRRNIHVIPLYVDGMHPLKPEDLPQPLKGLARRNAAFLDTGIDFDAHIARLITDLETLVQHGATADHLSIERIEPTEAGTHDQEPKSIDAVSKHTKAIEADPTDAEAYYERGGAYFAKGRYDKAIADFTKAIAINPRYVAAYDDRGKAYLAKGEFDLAVRDHSSVIERNTLYTDAYINRGKAYLAKGEFELAIVNLSRAIALSPHADAYYHRSRVYLAQGDRDRATADWDKAIRLVLERYTAERFDDRAITDSTKMIERDLNDVYAYIRRGRAHLAKGDYDRSIADFSKAIDINPKVGSGLIYRYRARAHAAKGSHDRAISDYGKFIEANPEDDDGYYDRGQIYFEKKEYLNAIADYTKTIELYRWSWGSSAYKERAWAYLHAGKPALGLADSEIALAREASAAALDTRAHMLEALGRREEAISDFRRALLRDPTLRGSHDGLIRLRKNP